MKPTQAATAAKQVFATLKSEFVMTPADMLFLESLPDNLPDNKLTAKQREGISAIYYKYVANKITYGWGGDVYELELKERWTGNQRVKRHEAQRMILGHIVSANKYYTELTAEQAATKFFSSLTCRESYTITLSKIYNLKNS